MNWVDAAPRELAPLLRALSKPGAMQLFALAGQGISKSTYAMKELGLSQKQYYTRLKELVDAGVVEGREGSYRLTGLGLIVYRRVIPILAMAYENREKLNILDEIGAVNLDDKLKEFLAEALDISGLFGLVDPEGGHGTIRVVDDYEALVDQLNACMEGGEKSILIASNYTDSRTIDAMFRAHKRGLKVRVISDANSKSLNKWRMILSPKLMEALIYYISNLGDIGEIARRATLQFSFCVIDGSMCLFEFPSLMGNKFSIGFMVNDHRTGERFTEIFDKIWDGASPISFLRLGKI